MLPPRADRPKQFAREVDKVMSYWGEMVGVGIIPTNPADNEQSTTATIREMIRLANDSARHPLPNSIVASLQCQLPPRPTSLDLIRSIFWFVKGRVRFREDEDILVKQMGYTDPYQELLISPIALLQMPRPEGDCDDFSMLVATLLLVAKLPVWYVAIAVDEKQPDRWSHIYCKVYLPDENRYMAMDASHGQYPGWETGRRQFKRMEWKV